MSDKGKITIDVETKDGVYKMRENFTVQGLVKSKRFFTFLKEEIL